MCVRPLQLMDGSHQHQWKGTSSSHGDMRSEHPVKLAMLPANEAGRYKVTYSRVDVRTRGNRGSVPHPVAGGRPVQLLFQHSMPVTFHAELASTSVSWRYQTRRVIANLPRSRRSTSAAAVSACHACDLSCRACAHIGGVALCTPFVGPWPHIVTLLMLPS